MTRYGDELTALAENNRKRADAVKRSPRTITRWRREPPKMIRDLLSSAEGRRLLYGWLRAAETTPQRDAA